MWTVNGRPNLQVKTVVSLLTFIAAVLARLGTLVGEEPAAAVAALMRYKLTDAPSAMHNPHGLTSSASRLFQQPRGEQTEQPPEQSPRRLFG
jgi:hypothetical protein